MILKKYLAILILSNLCFAPISAISSMLADYDANWENNTAENQIENTQTNIWTTLDTGHAIQSISLGQNSGVHGNAAKTDITAYGTDGLFKNYFAYDEDRYATLDASKNTNRMILYAKIPYAGDGNEHTFHIGTYSKNPATASSTTNVGMHWYHYYEVRGNDQYWMKFYMNEHPQHMVSNDDPPPNNPTLPEFDYFDGLTRLYLQMAYSPFKSSWPGPYTVLVDEIEFYQETRTENDYSINGVVITYFGNGTFDIDWSSFSQYDIMPGTYEIRYSNAPVTTEDQYQAAPLVPGSPSAGWGEENVGHHDNHYRASFTIPNFDQNLTYYFAIKDLYEGHPQEFKLVDYKVAPDGTTSQIIPPPSNVKAVTN